MFKNWKKSFKDRRPLVFFREISRYLGRYLIYLTLILLVPLGVAVFYEFAVDSQSHPQAHSSIAFIEAMGVCLFLALVFLHFGKKAQGTLYRRESILLVALIWFITAGIGALPFLFSKTFDNPIDAYFESMSGLTTTGATVIHPKAYDPYTNQEIPISRLNPNQSNTTHHFFGTITPIRHPQNQEILFAGVEAIGKALLFWRSFLQWIGGMGIVVLFIAVLPALSMGGKFLFETEIPGPNKEAMTPRIKETASMLWKIYLGLTIVQIALLLLTNPHIPVFDAITLSFSTISTGGFSVRNEGIAAYQSLSVNWIVMVFMILGSLNFSLYFHCLRGKVYRIYEPEFFVYIAVLLGASLLMTFNLWGTPQVLFTASSEVFSFGQSLFLGAFQAISAQTSTGFFLGNEAIWPLPAQLLMLILVFIGGMSGSTSGGIKISRQYILFRVITHKIESIFRPHCIRSLKINHKETSDKTALTVLIFLCILIFFAVLGTYLLVLDKIDPSTAFSIIASLINNAGLSYDGITPMSSCAFLSNFSKIIGIIWMMLGRLEFLALLVLLVPAFWRGK